MKITYIAGSPRQKSDSTKVARQLNQHLEEKGALVNSYQLNKMNYQGCQACYSCKKTKDRCVLKDDLSPVLEEIFETDILVISTPIYFWDLPGHLKMVIDRMYSFGKNDWKKNPEPSRLPKGKHMVFIQTQEAKEHTHVDVYQKYEAIFKVFSGFSYSHFLRVSNLKPGYDFEKDEKIKQEIEQLSKKLFPGR